MTAKQEPRPPSGADADAPLTSAEQNVAKILADVLVAEFLSELETPRDDGAADRDSLPKEAA